MMMIELTVNDKDFTTPSLNEAVAFFDVVHARDFARNFRMNVYFGSGENRTLTRSYYSNHPVNASADFDESVAFVAMECEPTL